MSHSDPRRVRAALAALALGALALAATAWAQRVVPTGNPDRPRIRYPDSLTSVNDHCVVSQSKLNPRVHPVYVNGEPIGFC